MPFLFGTVLYYNIAIYDVVHVHNINNNTIVQYYCTYFIIIIIIMPHLSLHTIF